MKVAVLSGKGGAGKTFVSVNLAVTAGRATYIDCDVEEPDGRLFLKPSDTAASDVSTMLPNFSLQKCTGCRKCVNFCRFNALAFIGGKPRVYSEICHSCGGCALVCPSDAVWEEPRPVGRVEVGTSGEVTVVTGVMNLGEASAVPTIKAALQKGLSAKAEWTVIDCPPGSGCAVMESVSAADYCLLVAEPTAFGLHNMKMVHELARLLHKPCGVVVNKSSGAYPPLTAYCEANGLSVLCEFPYREAVATLNAKGEIACEKDAETERRFAALLTAVRGEVEACANC